MLKKLMLICVIALLTTAAAGLSACQTAEGFGKDMENAGKNIQKAVDK